MAPIVQCMGLTKTYGRKIALNQIHLNLERSRIIGLLGPNGSGKSTLIKIINGLLQPTAGDVLINGHRPGIDTKFRISYLPERTYLNPGMKVIEVVQYFQDFYPDFRMDRAYDMLSRLQIQPNERLKNLSKGTKEKVQLILVMSRDADLYILDEPIAGVDPASRDYILHTIVSNYNRNASILLSTHLISDVENILDDVVFIKYGSIVLQAGAEQIRQNEHKSIDRFFREVFAC
ncbi:MAG: ABC transporter ATP-binding protein [Lachnospiraceae bacterium]|jgi:ABC-2 type transport system ATP-binding protein|nr:ABC transporter ATP-binding protein [Lachnospiraceae bacterium]